MIYNYFQLRHSPPIDPYIKLVTDRISELEKEKKMVQNSMLVNGRVGIHRKLLESIRTIDRVIETNKELLEKLKS